MFGLAGRCHEEKLCRRPYDDNDKPMQTRNKHIRDIFLRLLGEYQNDHAVELLDKIEEIIEPAGDSIAEVFYGELMVLEEASYFLNQTLVTERLSKSLAAWVNDLVPAFRSGDLAVFIETQIKVGNIHARINVPMYLVNHGGRIIKREISLLIKDSPAFAGRTDEMLDAVLLMDQIIDTSVSLINEGYFSDLLENEQNTQALRSEVMSNNMAALEIERLRGNLFDWLRHVLSCLHQEGGPNRADLSIHKSEFGLWMLYKSELVFGERTELKELELRARELEALLDRLLEEKRRDDGDAVIEVIKCLNEVITNVSWLLSNLANQLVSMESSRDPLTSLFNRRFLGPILQKSTKNSITYGLSYALVLVDVDHFKQHNDRYGHGVGDSVLQQIASRLSQSVRGAGDYVFRYGGEEFLVLVNDITDGQAEKIAENIRDDIEKYRFEVDGVGEVRVTVSCGVVVHDGHPDYNHIVGQADKALYRAKREGRNRVVLYQPEMGSA